MGKRVIYNQKQWVSMHLCEEPFSPILYIPFWPLDIGTPFPALTGICLREEECHEVDEHWISMSCWWPTVILSLNSICLVAPLCDKVSKASPAPVVLDKEVQFWWGHALWFFITSNKSGNFHTMYLAPGFYFLFGLEFMREEKVSFIAHQKPHMAYYWHH